MSSGGNCNTRVQISPAKHWCFTYNSYLEKDINSFLSVLIHSSKKYVFQEERGESGNLHLQGYICFNRRVRPKGVFSAFKTIHWEKTKNIKASILYCSDQDKRIEGGRIWSAGVNIQENISILADTELKQWQSEIKEVISKDPDERSIYWVWEPIGGVGKSVFCKYLCVKFNALLLSGKGADMKYGIVKYKETVGLYPKLILIDIPRSIKDYVSYSGIESVKNGCFFSGKYEGQMCLFNSPHIICFANQRPDKDKLSRDRWKIREIINDMLYCS